MKVDNARLDITLAKKCLSITELRCKGLSPQTLSRIRHGESVKPKTIGKLAQALGVDPAEIIKEEV